MGWFSSGEGDYNRELKAQRDAALGFLSQGGISGTFTGLRQMYAPMLSSMMGDVNVGANMDQMAIQGRLAALGLGDSGLGIGAGSATRTAGVLAGNRLRAQLAMDAMEKAIGLQQSKAQTVMAQALGMKLEAGPGAKAWNYAMEGAEAVGNVMAGYGSLDKTK